MNVKDNQVDYRLKAFSDLQIRVNSFSKKRALVVFDKTGAVRTDVEVRINKKKIPFHVATQSFNFFYKKEEALITVHSPEGDFYFEYNDDSFDDDKTFGERVKETEVYAYYQTIKWFTRRQFRKVGSLFTGKDLQLYTGYMAFNKPKYLPGDTVKMKSFIVHLSGKPVSKTLELYLSEYYGSSKRKLLATIKPEKKGNYVFEFVLPDSLQTGKGYTLTLEKDNKKFIEGRFRLEDYQLDETSYKFRTDKLTYISGEPIQLYMKGTDANGLPLLDASVKLTAITNGISALEPRQVFVPYYVWEHEQKLDNIGETKIIFPDSLIPRINMSIKIAVLFKNSNNETHEETQTITIKRRTHEIKIKNEEGYILADYQQGRC